MVCLKEGGAFPICVQSDLPVLPCCVVRSSFKMDKFVIRKVPTSVQELQTGGSNSKVSGATETASVPTFPPNAERRDTPKEPTKKKMKTSGPNRKYSEDYLQWG